MELGKRFLFCVLHGIKDCITGMCSLINVLSAQEPIRQEHQHGPNISEGGSIKNKLMHCIVFGLLFWSSNYVYNKILLNTVIAFLVNSFGEEINNVPWLLRVLNTVFLFSWILPLFALSKLLNFLWYQDIADLIFVRTGIRRNTDIKFSHVYADQCKTLILQLFYCLQGCAIYFVPLPTFIQHLWYLFHFALLSSLYAFEYKWVHMGWPLHRRLLSIDRKWPYYLGFGLPIALVTTFFVSFIDSMIVFATLFPIYVISSAYTSDSQSPLFSHPFHSFKIVDSVSDVFITFIMSSLGAVIMWIRR